MNSTIQQIPNSTSTLCVMPGTVLDTWDSENLKKVWSLPTRSSSSMDGLIGEIWDDVLKQQARKSLLMVRARVIRANRTGSHGKSSKSNIVRPLMESWAGKRASRTSRSIGVGLLIQLPDYCPHWIFLLCICQFVSVIPYRTIAFQG